ncbi:spermatogenesis-associated protein 7 homolog isoform X2 [Parasteatoda tepidariorum]|uniref:spermatogenesis-associated protein 7 homolog isoform X2 n=1 Tax=Parasteatoda tepidariorum TaxID=114398 RepID=UPI00077FCE62|nr:spermatogenesis-associated protein 7 isoform X2 [Parasteatoda tepidariorum]
MDASLDQDDEDFFDSQLSSAQTVRLSHLNNKSSVLCPKSQNITSQYLALQQLDAHQKMIARAKVVGQQKKKLWRKSPSQSKSSELKETFNAVSHSSSRPQPFLSDEEDNASLNASSVNRAIQTSIPLVSFGNNTDDKITWYLEALRQGELLSHPFAYTRESSKEHSHLATSMNKRRTLNGDILDTHVNCFSKSKKPFSPRVVADTAVKSKLKEMRCYQPPVRRKKKSSENSSDTFESYHGEDSEEDSKEEEKDFHNPPEDVETQINMKTSSERNFNLNDRLHDYLIHQNRVKFESNGKKESPNRNDEDKYLEFLSKVTEHILRSGVYSDRAIQQAFDFHMQFYQEDDNKDKLQLLLNQVMEGMKISSSDSEEIPCNKSSPFLSRPNTPPVKELPGIFPFTARNDESTEEYPPSISSQAQNVEDLLSDPHLLSDSGISIRQTDS